MKELAKYDFDESASNLTDVRKRSIKSSWSFYPDLHCDRSYVRTGLR